MYPTFSITAISLALLKLAEAAVVTLTVYDPGHPLDGIKVEAAGQSFYASNAAPAAYCPTQVTNCPNATDTVVTEGFTAMYVEVPGGQQVYTAPNGAISFTQAHSIYVPTGSYIGGFTNTTVECGTVLNFKAYDFDQGGIFACDTGVGNSLKLYGRTPGFNSTNCTEVAGLLEHPWNSSLFGAWQYT